MRRRTSLSPAVALMAFAFCLPAPAQATTHTLSLANRQTALFSVLNTDTDRDRDGLVGPVRRVKTEMVKLATRGGKVVEGQRVVLESVAYDIKGGKIESAYFPVPGGALTGKEVYKYDDKGNIVEMSLFNADGSLLSKEIYAYEFDAFGNWTKMTTSVAVIEGGKLNFEPTEITYRTISYYLDEATLAKMNEASSSGAANSSAAAQPGAANKPAQPAPAAVVAQKSTTAPLPSGASLVKTNMPTLNAALNSSATAAAGSMALKVEDEPPPPASASRPVPKPLLKPVSGGVLNGKALVLPKPNYPPAARSARASGTVTVEVVIDEAGKVIAAKATEGNALLRQAAVQAAQGARFSPTMLSGQPVKVSGEINYTFTLQQ